MLRRLSLHAAHIEERSDTYLWENLGASTFEAGAAAGFGKITEAQRQYAIAGTLHHHRLAVLAELSGRPAVLEAHRVPAGELAWAA